MGRPGLLGTWILSALLLAFVQVEAAPEVTGVSRLGLVLLPWMASGLFPRADGAVPFPSFLALSLPLLAIAAALDLRGGRTLGETIQLIGPAGLAWMLWAKARSVGGQQVGYKVCWGLLVPGSAALLLALGWAGAGAPTHAVPQALGWLARLNPLVWTWAATRSQGLVEAGLDPLPVLAAAAVLVVCAWEHRARSEVDP